MNRWTRMQFKRIIAVTLVLFCPAFSKSPSYLLSSPLDKPKETPVEKAKKMSKQAKITNKPLFKYSPLDKEKRPTGLKTDITALETDIAGFKTDKGSSLFFSRESAASSGERRRASSTLNPADRYIHDPHKLSRNKQIKREEGYVPFRLDSNE